MVGMCDKPAGIAAAAAGAKPGAGVEDIDGGMVDVGTGSDDYAPGGGDDDDAVEGGGAGAAAGGADGDDEGSVDDEGDERLA